MAEPRYIGPFRVGELINSQYRVIRLLGEGGHAYVYECHDDVLDAVVAIKVIATTVGRDQELFKRAKAEAQVMFRLSHPNVVKVHSALVIEDSMLGIVMEKLEGLTLRMMLGVLGRLTIVEALMLVRQIAVGVGAAHKLNVVHRDIKPENVFVLPPDNSVKVLDFGIAKFIGHGLQTTNKDRLHGTPLYMSPEHLQSANVTPRSDIYQLGTVLFELIAGVNPCLVGQEVQDARQAILLQISRVAPPLSTVVQGVSPGLDKLIQCAVAKDPTQRFDSMDKMVDAIDRAIEERVRTHPQDGQIIRFVDAAMMQAARERESRADSDEPIDPPPTSNNSQKSKPLVVSDSTSADSANSAAEARRSAPGEAGAATNEPPTTGRSALAPTIEVRPRSRDQGDVAMQPRVATSPTPSQVQATSLVAVSEPAAQRRARQLSVWLVATPVLLGVIAGTGISLKWRQYDREALDARVGATSPALATSIAPDVSALPEAGRSEERSEVVDVAPLPAANASSTAPTGIAQGRRTKPFTTKKSSNATVGPDMRPRMPELLRESAKKEPERARTPVREFNANIEPTSTGGGRVKR